MLERGNGLGAVYDIRRTPQSRRVDAHVGNDLTAAALEGGVELIDRLSREWLDLCFEGPCNEPFCRPDWIAAYLRAFEPKSRIVLATARADGRLRAVLPLIRDRRKPYGLPIRRLRSAGNAHSGPFDLVHGVGDAAPAARAVWRALHALEDWDVIELEHVPNDGAMRLLLTAAGEDGHPTGARGRSSAPYLSLPPAGGDPELAFEHVTERQRKRLQASRRKLEALGPVKVTRTVQTDPRMLQGFYRLEQSGWKGEQGTAISSTPQTNRFYDALPRLRALRGSVTLWTLHCGPDAVAMQYGVTYGWTYFGLRTAYDERFARYSPGHLLMEDIVREAYTRGLRAIDFTLGSDDLTARWSSGERALAGHYVFGRSTAGRLLHLRKRSRFTPASPYERSLRHLGA